jgi:selenoprotein W-related protein
VRATDDLLSSYQHVIDDLRLVMGTAGAFEVTCDGQPLYSKKATGRHAEPGEVLQRFTEHVGPGVARYGT